MNLERFIALRIRSNQEQGKSISKPAVKIATGGVALGLMVMILAVAIVIGFKSEVRNKLIGFGSHIEVGIALGDKAIEVLPMERDSQMMQALMSLPHVRHTQSFANQPAIMKTDNAFQGIVLKGVGEDYDWTFFSENLTAGSVPRYKADSISKDVLISKKIADALQLNIDDRILTYFVIDGKVRVRPLKVRGIYSTGFGDYDQTVVLGDIANVQKLNGWNGRQIGGMEITIDDYDNLDEASRNVFDVVGNRIDIQTGNMLEMHTIKEMNPQIFNWLDMLDVNVAIILVLMILVAGFTIISGLMILILERTNMIGLLKAMGARNWSIRKIFLYETAFLVGKGMLIGNILGLALCALQAATGLITLDPEVYYVDKVPIELGIGSWLLINAGVFLASMAMLVGPSYIVTKISPAETMRFE